MTCVRAHVVYESGWVHDEILFSCLLLLEIWKDMTGARTSSGVAPIDGNEKGCAC